MVHTLNPRKQTCGFTGFALKRIAVCSMVIDHIGSIVMDGVIAPYRVNDTIILTADMPFFVRNAFLIKTICAALGSAAFTLFCFLVAEGFIHTRNRLRYAGLLALFALLSEVPYDVAHYQTVLDFSLQNVLFTLCVGVFTRFTASAARNRKALPYAFCSQRYVSLPVGASPTCCAANTFFLASLPSPCSTCCEAAGGKSRGLRRCWWRLPGSCWLCLRCCSITAPGAEAQNISFR